MPFQTFHSPCLQPTRRPCARTYPQPRISTREPFTWPSCQPPKVSASLWVRLSRYSRPTALHIHRYVCNLSSRNLNSYPWTMYMYKHMCNCMYSPGCKWLRRAWWHLLHCTESCWGGILMWNVWMWYWDTMLSTQVSVEAAHFGARMLKRETTRGRGGMPNRREIWLFQGVNMDEIGWNFYRKILTPWPTISTGIHFPGPPEPWASMQKPCVWVERLLCSVKQQKENDGRTFWQVNKTHQQIVPSSSERRWSWWDSAVVNVAVQIKISQLLSMSCLPVKVSPCRSLFVASPNVATSQPRQGFFECLCMAPEDPRNELMWKWWARGLGLSHENFIQFHLPPEKAKFLLCLAWLPF